MAEPTPAGAPAVGARVASLDAYRGLVMALMLGEALQLPGVAESFPGSPFWRAVAFHTDHVAWAGCSLHDLIQPSFSFLVGAALPFSVAARRAAGQSAGRTALHAAWRAILLVALGVFLRSLGHRQTNFTFEDTLSQIGLGYLPLFVLARTPARVRWAALVVVLVGYWAAFAAHPAPSTSGSDYPAVGVPADWPHHYQGFLSHWNKNSNLAWEFDTWLLNRLPRASPFRFNGGGYATLSFVPTLGTMLLGLIAGEWVRAGRSRPLFAAGVVCLAIGAASDALGVCPVVKRIWTPAWVLFSGGWCLLALAILHAICDLAGLKRWAFPFLVIGANSIAIYCLHGSLDGFVREAFRVHLGRDIFGVFGPEFEPLVGGAAVLVADWLLLYWLWRRQIFVRI